MMRSQFYRKGRKEGAEAAKDIEKRYVNYVVKNDHEEHKEGTKFF
ncbi:MAG TPA: hypothetical protein VK957_22215 [Lunatimonas sp.]|nr:hypothetical protein [Lunatimonas sp.]